MNEKTIQNYKNISEKAFSYLHFDIGIRIAVAVHCSKAGAAYHLNNQVLVPGGVFKSNENSASLVGDKIVIFLKLKWTTHNSHYQCTVYGFNSSNAEATFVQSTRMQNLLKNIEYL